MPGDTIEISKIKDKEKYNSNFDSIDWGNLKDKPIEKKPETKKHVTAGLCGEFGMSTFDEKAYKENFDQIKWTNNNEVEVDEITVEAKPVHNLEFPTKE